MVFECGLKVVDELFEGFVVFGVDCKVGLDLMFFVVGKGKECCGFV